MPREVVQYPRRVKVGKLEDADSVTPEHWTESDTPRVEVGWHPQGQESVSGPVGDGWVQVHLVTKVGFLQNWIKDIDVSDPDAEIRLFSEVLSRKEINLFVRTLKRSRNSAYGADE